MARGPRLPKKDPVRAVPVLFPNDRDATAAEIDLYRRVQEEHGRYVFAVDRQSDNKELLRQSATGQMRRVEAILGMARQVGYLKPPVLLTDRHEGQLAYQFDRDFWFLDGELKNATGYAASVHARPEFWRAFLLTKALAKQGCGPAAFIVGESTRFFRDRKWLTLFTENLWEHGIRVFVGGFGEITPNTFPGLLAMINALSAWLPEARRGARVARRQRGELMQKRNIHLGLLPAADGKGVVADPEVWPFLRQLCYALDSGEVRTLAAASGWLQERGIVRSLHWVRQLLLDRPILDGLYDAHAERMIARKLESGHLQDLDVNANGHRRYLIQRPDDPLLLPIDFAANGMEPIPPAVLLRARARIRGSGRPRVHAPPPGLFLSGKYLRCAVCGSRLAEAWERGHRPAVICRPPPRLVSSRASEEYREKVETAWAMKHVRHAVLDEPLSAKVWRTLVEEAQQLAPDPRLLPAPPPQVTEAGLRARLTEQQDRLDRHMAGLGVIAGLGPAALDSFQRQAALLAQAVENTQTELNAYAAGLLRNHQQDAALTEFRKLLAMYHDQISEEEKAELLALVVERIDVHLEEHWYCLHVNASAPALQGLIGRWGQEVNNNTSRAWSIVIRARLRGEWVCP